LSNWGEYPIAFLGLLGLVCLATAIQKRRAGGAEGFVPLAAVGIVAALLFGALFAARAVEELAAAARSLGLP